MRSSADGKKTVRHSYQEKRSDTVYRFFEVLYDLGYEVRKPSNVKPKHVRAWLRHMKTVNTCDTETVLVCCTHLKTFFGWLGKTSLCDELTQARAYLTGQPVRRQKPSSVKRRLTQSIKDVLEFNQQNKRHAVRDKSVGHSTSSQREEFYYRFATELVDMGYRLTDIRGLRLKHIVAWVQDLEAKGRKPSTLQKYVSMIKTLTTFIGKPGMMGDPRDLLVNPANFQRQYVSNIDKSDEGKAIDWPVLSQLVLQHEPRLAAQYALMKPFGLRFEEAAKLKPELADRGNYLHVVEGTKGGRPRDVSISTQEQRQVLDHLKTLVVSPQGSTIPKRLRYNQWKDHAYYINRKVGFTKALAGYTPHGLRHGFANNRYQELAGTASPVRGGSHQLNDPEFESKVRLQVSRELGHSREQITSAYIGSKSNTNVSVEDDES